jgi:hypothetical protein
MTKMKKLGVLAESGSKLWAPIVEGSAGMVSGIPINVRGVALYTVCCSIREGHTAINVLMGNIVKILNNILNFQLFIYNIQAIYSTVFLVFL